MIDEPMNIATTTTSMKPMSTVTEERLSAIQNRIADFLCAIQGDIELFQYECEKNQWDDVVLFDVKDACLKLGYSLASFHNWNKNIE